MRGFIRKLAAITGSDDQGISAEDIVSAGFYPPAMGWRLAGMPENNLFTFG
ncbi:MULTISPECIES: hypothetical protein [Agrobacterium]|uniref:hypothetical protein n=1 Tax=Agrobacterium TaxID=357 RepID=UPI001386BB8E|nr:MULTISPECIES: hypothetical protein [Agrobacterium]MDA5248784.1 hypothetical protein [Agrobacterium sp. MAFF210268]